MPRRHWLLAALLASTTTAQAQAPDLALTWLGRDAVFVEMGSVVRDGDKATFRILRVVEGAEPIAGELYIGGWQSAVIDCRARTFRGLTFASLRESGVTGPESALRGEAFEIAGGSAEAGMEAAVCRGAPAYVDRVSTVQEAAKLGRARMRENDEGKLNRSK